MQIVRNPRGGRRERERERATRRRKGLLWGLFSFATLSEWFLQKVLGVCKHDRGKHFGFRRRSKTLWGNFRPPFSEEEIEEIEIHFAGRESLKLASRFQRGRGRKKAIFSSCATSQRKFLAQRGKKSDKERWYEKEMGAFRAWVKVRIQSQEASHDATFS